MLGCLQVNYFEGGYQDLLGSDMPVEGGTGAEFQWSDGVFLQVSSIHCFLEGVISLYFILYQAFCWSFCNLRHKEVVGNVKCCQPISATK